MSQRASNNTLNFRVYLRRDGRISRLFTIKRTSRSLYTIFAPHPEMRQYVAKYADHRTYHEDGKCFDYMAGKIIDKTQKQPLAGFSGVETQFIAVHTLFTMSPEDLQDRAGIARPQDIVLDLRGWFAVEMIISDQPLQLAEIPARVNRLLREYTNVQPIITVEAFEMADNMMPRDRYPPLQKYELGKNWLIGEGGCLP